MDLFKKTWKDSLLKWTHYPYRAIEKDPFANSKVLVFHIMSEV